MATIRHLVNFLYTILIIGLILGNNTPILDSLAVPSKSTDGKFHIFELELYIHNNKLDGPRICANGKMSEKRFQLWQSTNYTEKAVLISREILQKSPQSTKSISACDPKKRFCAFEEMKFALIESIIDV
uniref:Uncharacterized protein n=1 Tax=Glossina austeni TaxID=7395 RepID=A0A1A9VFT7_GLOAU